MRSRVLFSFAALLLLGSLLSSCVRWRMIGDSPAADAKTGAAIGFTIGGPEGAAIGSVLMAVVGAFVRSREKRSLRSRGLLTDRRQQQEAITARTIAAQPRQAPPQTHLPTDSTIGD